MGCLGNSKTEDQRNEEKAQREANKKIEKQLQKDKQIYRATHRLLLLGEFDFFFSLALSLSACSFSGKASVCTVEALLPPCITFWDVVLGNIVNSMTLPLHKAKNAAIC